MGRLHGDGGEAGGHDGLRRHLTGRTGGHRLRFGSGAAGIERLEASLIGEGFAPHRHDTYAIGVTLAGVQTFRYRGELRHCLPGDWHVLHPDEVHDGMPGTDEGFGYRILYVDPFLVQQALGGRPLPFVADPVVRRRDVRPPLSACLRRIDEPLDDLERLDVALLVADLLERHSAPRPGGRAGLALEELSRVRELITEDPVTRRSVEELERISGLDRWTLARQFRAAFGTSPTRFRTMRQLDRVRRLLRGGTPPREAALEAGFADQSHMTRMFKRAYGMTPGAWTAALTGP
ncbi:araC family transcriptional regulator [Planomonospora sphaerica]|uniref:AraC family transcriptional regulator n=1 Tax=Planomonospora sphaerica TaxID=161355 RepID=A0A171CKJ6_9ACTN|nr:AraC family transcriptional regulator [Planomonospora sphaerica]GAT66849.1 araC family transcriptional regulator [Planomonospora sphaerica]